MPMGEHSDRAQKAHRWRTTADVALSGNPPRACEGRTSKVAPIGPRSVVTSATLAAGSADGAEGLGISATSAVQHHPHIPLTSRSMLPAYASAGSDGCVR
jgi:hypothetical protein